MHLFNNKFKYCFLVYSIENSRSGDKWQFARNRPFRPPPPPPPLYTATSRTAQALQCSTLTSRQQSGAARSVTRHHTEVQQTRIIAEQRRNVMWDFRFSRRRVWRLQHSGTRHCVGSLKYTVVSEVRNASIITAIPEDCNLKNKVAFLSCRLMHWRYAIVIALRNTIHCSIDHTAINERQGCATMQITRHSISSIHSKPLYETTRCTV
jgi:hypothetical protein